MAKLKRMVRAHAAALPLTLLIVAGSMATALGAEAVPEDFVYLLDHDPTIQQDMRYASSYNFTGKPVPGCGAAECVLVRQAAEALKKFQTDLKPKGLTLHVSNCYRPTQAVAAFVAWSKKLGSPKAKAAWYPNLDRPRCFPTTSPRAQATRAASRLT
jgi:D-alanyl-D-alanine dipeptidase